MNDVMEIIRFSEKLPIRLLYHQVEELPLHFNKGLEIILVLKGQSTITLSDSYYSLKEDDIILINDGESYKIQGNGLISYISLYIDTEKINNLDEELRFSLNSASDNEKGKYRSIKRLLATLVKNNSTDQSDDLKNQSILYEILYELKRDFPFSGATPNSPKHLERLNEITFYISEHYREKLTLQDVATHFSFSVPYLSAFFKKMLGVNFKDYYTNLCLERAVNDLLHTDDSIETISENNGFVSPRSFLVAFKDKYGTLPSLYRKNATTDNTKGSENIFDDEFDRTSYMTILAKYLPDSPVEENKIGRLSNKYTSCTNISLKEEGKKLKHTYKKFIAVGRAKELLFADVQEMLKELQNDVHYEYIKFHGLLSDDMLVYAEDADGNPHYSFHYIDMAFDFLVSIGLKPLVQFSFMPKALAKDPSRQVYASPYVLSMPKSMDKWCALIKELVIHLCLRYGYEAVRSWLFCCWNEPDTSTTLFGFQNDSDYYELYKATYDTVKGLDERFIFGSPSLLISYNVNQVWCENYIRWTKENGCLPDFMNIHYYDNDFSDESLNKHAPGRPAHTRLNRDENSFSKCISKTHNLFTSWGIGNLPVYLTEWNLTVSHRNLLNDTCFKSCYLAKNLLENYDKLDSFGYWMLTDLNEEIFPSRNEFHGGLGLFTFNGIKKPHYHVFSFLSKLGERLIRQGQGYFITRSHRKIVILAYNYEHFNHLYAEGEVFDMDYTRRYMPFNKSGDMELSLEFIDMDTSNCIIRESVINQNSGSAFDEWIKMGAKPLNRNDISYLKSISYPAVHVTQRQINDEKLAIDAHLEPLEVRLIEIFLSRN